MAVNLIRGKNRKGYIVLASVVVLLLLIATVIVTVTNVTREQERDSLVQLKDGQLKTLLDARSKLPPAANAYLAAYKEAQNAGGTREKAEQDSTEERDTFKQAEASARDALGALKAGRGTGEDQVGDAVAQFEDSYLGFIDYMAGLVDSYPEYDALFRKGEEGCQGIFIGDRTSNLNERKDLLTKAAGVCRSATEKLGQSKNSTYAEYAGRVENRVKQLEVDAAATATAEQNVEAFTATKDQLVKKVDEATKRNAPDEELLAIADELKSLNQTITANRSEFDFAAKRYTKTVKEMPSLLEDVFSTHVPAEMKYYDSVVPMRLEVLKAVVDDELVE